VADAARIEELRRRVRRDAASIAFAQLAEEHRRAGEFEEAVRICRAGLAQHPGYLSARVTLARALIELGQLEEAAADLERVLQAAPDNLAALRAFEDIAARLSASGRAATGAAPPVEERSLDVTSSAVERRLTEEARAFSDRSGQRERALAQLEAWLVRIEADRMRRQALI
jgi:tetratricopeptide (TPR) repeat protein